METTVYSKPINSHLYPGLSFSYKKSCKNDIIKMIKLREYMAHLVARGNFAKLVKYEFDKMCSLPSMLKIRKIFWI